MKTLIEKPNYTITDENLATACAIFASNKDNHFSLEVATHPHAHRNCKNLIEVCHCDFIDDDMWDDIANPDNRFDQLLEDYDNDVELALVDVIEARYSVWCDWCEETDEEGRELLEKAWEA